MKLQTYFTEQQQNRLSDEEKVFLYQRICNQRGDATHTLKRAFLTKKKVYAFLATLMVFIFFGTYLRETPNIKEYRAFFSEGKIPGINTVNAAQVAKILEINGEYLIEKEGKTFHNSVLFDGDIITLKANAKIIFDINEHIKAEVVGPAKFTVNQISENNYRLYLIEGDFLKLDGQDDTDALQIETDEMTIKTAQNDTVAFELTKTSQKTQIRNAGSPLIVRAKKAESDSKPTTLETAKLLTMQDDDIAQITDVQDFERILVNKKQLTHTLHLSGGASDQLVEESLVVLDEGVLLLSGGDTSFLASEDSYEIDSGAKVAIENELAYQSDEKKIPTEDQLSKITATLNKSFLLDDIQQFYDAKYLADDEKLQNAYKSIYWRLQSVADTCGVQLSSDYRAFASHFVQLERALEEYHFPPTKRTQFETFKKWILHIEGMVPTKSWKEYQGEVPAELHFE